MPLSGEMVHVVAPSQTENTKLPDVSRLKAFHIVPKQGVVMNPGVWHTSFVFSGETTCLMLTRASTTIDLVKHLNNESLAEESAIVELSQLDIPDITLLRQ